jgi:hypothetical protein
MGILGSDKRGSIHAITRPGCSSPRCIHVLRVRALSYRDFPGQFLAAHGAGRLFIGSAILG